MNRDVRDVQTELAGVAREIAKVLTTSPVDRERLHELDESAADLRSEIERLMPPPPVEVLLRGSRLVSGG